MESSSEVPRNLGKAGKRFRTAFFRTVCCNTQMYQENSLAKQATHDGVSTSKSRVQGGDLGIAQACSLPVVFWLCQGKAISTEKKHHR